jgi:hypothetical protein
MAPSWRVNFLVTERIDSLLRRLHYRSLGRAIFRHHPASADFVAVANLLFGIVSVISAAPITVVVYMTAKVAYVEDPLE